MRKSIFRSDLNEKTAEKTEQDRSGIGKPIDACPRWTNIVEPKAYDSNRS